MHTHYQMDGFSASGRQHIYEVAAHVEMRERAPVLVIDNLWRHPDAKSFNNDTGPERPAAEKYYLLSNQVDLQPDDTIIGLLIDGFGSDQTVFYSDRSGAKWRQRTRIGKGYGMQMVAV